MPHYNNEIMSSVNGISKKDAKTPKFTLGQAFEQSEYAKGQKSVRFAAPDKDKDAKQ